MSSTGDETIMYKILHKDDWAEAETVGVFKGAGIDLQDGFIHFSTAAQAKETASAYFSGQEGLVLVAVETEGFMKNDQLKWEASRGGAKFPHLFATLDPKKILWVKDLPVGVDGSHQFPDLVQNKSL